MRRQGPSFPDPWFQNLGNMKVLVLRVAVPLVKCQECENRCGCDLVLGQILRTGMSPNLEDMLILNPLIWMHCGLGVRLGLKLQNLRQDMKMKMKMGSEPGRGFGFVTKINLWLESKQDLLLKTRLRFVVQQIHFVSGLE